MNPCSENTECINMAPGYRCTGCPPGYNGTSSAGVGLEHAKQNRQVCIDIDECALGVNTCDVNSTCVNTQVSLNLVIDFIFYLHFNAVLYWHLGNKK